VGLGWVLVLATSESGGCDAVWRTAATEDYDQHLGAWWMSFLRQVRQIRRNTPSTLKYAKYAKYKNSVFKSMFYIAE
jgi:hypothetical protein